MTAIFEPIVHVVGSQKILDEDNWPSFHDGVIHNVNIWRGDMRPEEDIYLQPVVEVTIELTALKTPFIVVIKFHDCSDIELSGFDHNSEINDLKFEFIERGYFADSKTPLPPYIGVTFEKFENWGVSLKFKCMQVEAIKRVITQHPKAV